MLRNLSLVSLAICQASGVLLSKPSGKYHVGTTQHLFNKTTYDDIFAPGGIGGQILVTFFYPTLQKPEDGNIQPYLSHISAGLYEDAWSYPSGSLEALETELQFQAPPIEGPVGCNEKPTLIFSPGGGFPECALYSAWLGDLASHGYVVAAIDHPGEAPYLPLPYGGGGVYGLPIDQEFNDTLVTTISRIRINDTLSFLDLFPLLVEQYGAPFNTTHFALFGHSLGGSSSVIPLAQDDRLLGGIELDGTIVGPTADWTPIDEKKPILLLTSEGHELELDPSLQDFVNKQTGWFSHFTVNGSQHVGLSDIPLWVDVLGYRDPSVGNTPRIGNITGARITQILSTYSKAFFEFLQGEEECLLEGPSSEFPEVVYKLD